MIPTDRTTCGFWFGKAMIAAKVELAPELGYPSLGISAAELTEQITAAGFIGSPQRATDFCRYLPGPGGGARLGEQQHVWQFPERDVEC